MKVYVASKHLAQSTLLRRIKVFASKKDALDVLKDGATKKQKWVSVEVDVDGATVREQWTSEQQKAFDKFMDEHEKMLGITRDHFVQAQKDGQTPMEKLMDMIIALADKAQGVLTINQKLSQERSSLRTELAQVTEANRDMSKENDKLLLKLKQLNERLTDQSSAREIYEKEAKALREQLTERNAKLFARRLEEEAERIKENDKKAFGPVRLYSEDPAWKNWVMIIKACPKCGCAPRAFPGRTVGCSQGCSAKDDAESMSPEEWNAWALTYVNKDAEPRTRPEDYENGDIKLKIGGSVFPDEEETEVEVPPPDPDYFEEDGGDRLAEGYLPLIEDRLSTLEEQIQGLIDSNMVLTNVVMRLAERAPGQWSFDEVLRRIEEQKNRGVAYLNKIVGLRPGQNIDLRELNRIQHSLETWSTALQQIVGAVAKKYQDPDEAWLQVEAAVSTL